MPVDPSACKPHRLAFERSTHLYHFADFLRRHPPHDCPAIGNQVDDSDSGKRDERLANRGMTDCESVGQFLSHQVPAGLQFSTKYIRQQTFYDLLTQAAVVGLRCQLR